jgi:uncharacterized Zn-binding protein involved in type VI secretion
MPGFLVHVGATAMCPHGGQVTFVTANTRVLVSGQPAVTLSDMYTIAGCPFQIPIGTGTKPQPCVTGRWVVPATRVFVNGQPAILQASTGLCQSAEQIPQGPPTVVQTQVRVGGM